MKINRAFLLRWHWRIGLTAAIFLLIIAVTGLALNHARLLGLDKTYLDQEWVMKTYNMDVPENYIINIEPKEGVTTVETMDGTLTLGPGIDVREGVALAYRGEGITFEKLILDLHTGNIIGLPGKIVSDLTALSLIFLTGTGVYNLWRRKKG